MTIKTVALNTLEPSNANPRKAFDQNTIEGLAESIKQDGLLQNLIVSPTRGQKGRYRIISGERRYRAMQVLVARGDLEATHPVTVDVRARLNKDDTLRIASVENLQRQDLTPLEECDALTTLVQGKNTPSEIAAQTGLSLTTIRRRIALNALCEDAKTALAEDRVTLSQAEALALGTHADQCDVLEQIDSGYYDLPVSAIRDRMLDCKPSVAMAIFDMALYTGAITTDLLGEAETSYFDDVAQFMALQNAAVEALAARYGETTAWVEVTTGYSIPRWQYDEASDKQEAGVVINLAPSGKVEVLEGLAKRELPAETIYVLTEADTPKERAFYPIKLRRSIAHHKTMAVQQALFANPRTTLEIAVVNLLQAFTPHEALEAFAACEQPPETYTAMAEELQQQAERLDTTPDKMCYGGLESSVTTYHDVKQLSDAALSQLHIALTALSFGQLACDELDTGESLFNTVAADLDVDMCDHWRPDEAFFTQRTKAQLADVAVQIGYATHAGAVSPVKKSEMVTVLKRHIERAMNVDAATPEQQKAKNWLPGAMQFPAIDGAEDCETVAEALPAVA